jgi:large subunit ribosomal protein L18
MAKTLKSKSSRLKRKVRIRKTIVGSTERPRLSIFRSSKYTYAQIIDDSKGVTLCCASSRDKEVLELVAKVEVSKDEFPLSKSTSSRVAASVVGKVIGVKAKKLGIEKIVFDRNGFSYTGRVQALADGVREEGISF